MNGNLDAKTVVRKRRLKTRGRSILMQSAMD